MSQIDFDQDMAAKIEALYRIRDAVRRRGIVRLALAAVPDERILDVGCGPGFYCAELADEVGPSGSVVGLDSSSAMLELATRRFGRPTPRRYPSTTTASTPCSACRCSSTSPTPRWRSPRCTELFDRVGESSCGTSIGQLSRFTRWTPVSPSGCCAPGTSTSPTPHCHERSGPGCARPVLRKFAWLHTRSPRASSIRRRMAWPCSRILERSSSGATGSPTTRLRRGSRSSSSSVLTASSTSQAPSSVSRLQSRPAERPHRTIVCVGDRPAADARSGQSVRVSSGLAGGRRYANKAEVAIGVERGQSHLVDADLVPWRL
jgi:hypothetical protein